MKNNARIKELQFEREQLEKAYNEKRVLNDLLFSKMEELHGFSSKKLSEGRKIEAQSKNPQQDVLLLKTMNIVDNAHAEFFKIDGELARLQAELREDEARFNAIDEELDVLESKTFNFKLEDNKGCIAATGIAFTASGAMAGFLDYHMATSMISVGSSLGCIIGTCATLTSFIVISATALVGFNTLNEDRSYLQK